MTNFRLHQSILCALALAGVLAGSACDSNDRTRRASEDDGGPRYAAGIPSPDASPDSAQPDASVSVVNAAMEAQLEAATSDAVVDAVPDVAPAPAPTVVPVYPTNGAGWNAYVVSDGTSDFDASDTACTGDEPGQACSGCLHGGELRTAEFLNLASCNGLTVSDTLTAFAWVCDDSSGTVVVSSTALLPNKKLSDLLDIGGASFLPNAVALQDIGDVVAQSMTTVWWPTAVVAMTGTMNATADSIVLVQADLVGNVAMNATSRVAIVIAPGATLTGTGAGGAVVSGTNANFLSVEGAVLATGKTSGVSFYRVKCPVMTDLTATDALTEGIRCGECHQGRFTNLQATGGNGNGIELHSTLIDKSAGHVATGLTATNNAGTGILIDYSTAIDVSDVLVDGNVGTGLVLNFSDGAQLQNVTATNNGPFGVAMSFDTDASIFNITAAGNANGVRFEDTIRGTVGNIEATGNGDLGIQIILQGASAERLDNIFQRLTAVDNGGSGITFAGDFVTHNILLDWVATNNGRRGVEITNLDHAVVMGLITNNNRDEGAFISGCRNVTLANFTSTHNAEGMEIRDCEGGTFFNMTAAQNVQNGITMINSSFTAAENLATYANGGDGIGVSSQGSSNTAHNLLSTENGGFGIRLGSGTVVYSGALELGSNNANGIQCSVAINAFGLDDGGSVCAIQGASTAALSLNSSAVGEVFGPLTIDDAENPSDTNGAAPYANIGDWTNFETPTTLWGRDGTSVTDDTSRGPCVIGGTCRTWEWGIPLASTFLRNATPAPPSGDDTVTQTWYDSTPATSQADCDDLKIGSVYDSGGGNCKTTYLRAAVEIPLDGIGNEDGLCDSDEHCLYSPNIGAYQGHESLVQGEPFEGGAITGVSLWRHPANGY